MYLTDIVNLGTFLRPLTSYRTLHQLIRPSKYDSFGLMTVYYKRVKFGKFVEHFMVFTLYF